MKKLFALLLSPAFLLPLTVFGAVHEPTPGPISEVPEIETISINNENVVGDITISETEKNVKVLGAFTFSKEKMKREIPEAVVGFIPWVIGLFILIKIMSLLIAAFVATSLFESFSHKTIEHALSKPWRELSRGFAILVSVPIAATVLLMTVIGIPIAFMLMFLYGVFIILGMIFAGIIFGAWAEKIFQKTSSKTKKVELTWKIIVFGIISLTLISLIPFIGWLIAIVCFCITLGSAANAAYEKISTKSK